MNRKRPVCAKSWPGAVWSPKGARNGTGKATPGGAKDVPATGPGRAGKVLGFRVYTFVIATSVRVITSGKQLGGSGSA